MKLCRTSILFFAIFSTFNTAHAQEATAIAAFKLPNGLEIYVKPDHRSPVVISEIWYRVGSRFEPEGITGISHALEHMMFKGTSNNPGNSFATQISEAGGQQNAATTDDYTYYYEILPKDKLALSFALEADRMQNLAHDADDYAKEIEVVKEERRMRTDNNPQGKTYEMFRAAAYISSPYHHPTIGWQHDLDVLTIADVRSWYQHWYNPNHAILVVVGDVEPDAVMQLAEHYFGHIPAGKDVTIKPQKDVQADGTRRVQTNLSAQVPWLLMGFPVPTLASTTTAISDVFALSVLGDVLSGGEYARFAQNLVQKNRAASADISYDFFASLNSQWLINALPVKDQSLAQLEQVLWQEIKHLQTHGVKNMELQLAKQQRRADELYDRDSISNQADRIGILAINHLPMHWFDDYLAQLDAVTPLQVQLVAKHYLQLNLATIAELNSIPHSTPIAAPASTPGALS